MPATPSSDSTPATTVKMLAFTPSQALSPLLSSSRQRVSFLLRTSLILNTSIYYRKSRSSQWQALHIVCCGYWRVIFIFNIFNCFKPFDDTTFSIDPVFNLPQSFNLGRTIQVSSLLYSCLINIVHTGRNDNTLNARIQLSFFPFLAAVDNCNRISFWAIVTEDEGEQGKLFYDIILCTFTEPFIFLVPVWLFLLDEVPWSSD